MSGWMHNNGDNDDDGGNDGDDDDVQVIDHEEDNLSDKETYSKNIPAIGEIDIYSVLYSSYLNSINWRDVMPRFFCCSVQPI